MQAITAATRPCQAHSDAVFGAASTLRDRARCQSLLIRAGAGISAARLFSCLHPIHRTPRGYR
jgi:hypothetical protein